MYSSFTKIHLFNLPIVLFYNGFIIINRLHFPSSVQCTPSRTPLNLIQLLLLLLLLTYTYYLLFIRHMNVATSLQRHCYLELHTKNTFYQEHFSKRNLFYDCI